MALLFEGHKLRLSNGPKSCVSCLLMPAGTDGAQEGITLLLGAVQFRNWSKRKGKGTRALAQKRNPTFRGKLQFCMWPSAVSGSTFR